MEIINSDYIVPVIYSTFKMQSRIHSVQDTAAAFIWLLFCCVVVFFFLLKNAMYKFLNNLRK